LLIVTHLNAQKGNSMGFTMIPLLIHSDSVPQAARDALRLANAAPPETRAVALENAARVLYRETDLECGEVRDLVGLPNTNGCHC
jgi:hypothetical protein